MSASLFWNQPEDVAYKAEQMRKVGDDKTERSSK